VELIRTFSTSGGVARFALISVSAATPISALIGVGSLTLAGYMDPTRVVPVFMTWWLGDAVGALVVTPVITLWATPGAFRFATKREWIEGAAAYTSAGMIGLVAFGPLVTQTGTARPLGFLAILPLTSTALRGNQATQRRSLLSSPASRSGGPCWAPGHLRIPT
jgi:integral membrane sensor domain MASE1